MVANISQNPRFIFILPLFSHSYRPIGLSLKKKKQKKTKTLFWLQKQTTGSTVMKNCLLPMGCSFNSFQSSLHLTFVLSQICDWWALQTQTTEWSALVLVIHDSMILHSALLRPNLAIFRLEHRHDSGTTKYFIQVNVALEFEKAEHDQQSSSRIEYSHKCSLISSLRSSDRFMHMHRLDQVTTQIQSIK